MTRLSRRSFTPTHTVRHVDHVQRPKHLAAVQRVANEIECPHHILPRHNDQRLTLPVGWPPFRAARQIELHHHCRASDAARPKNGSRPRPTGEWMPDEEAAACGRKGSRSQLLQPTRILRSERPRARPRRFLLGGWCEIRVSPTGLPSTITTVRN